MALPLVTLNWGQAIVFAGISALTAVSTYTNVVPLPEVDVKSTVFSKGERVAVLDPKAEVKFRNNGGSPMVLTSVEIVADGKTCNTFAEALDVQPGAKYQISTESTRFFKIGHTNRALQKNSAVTLVTLRPPSDADVRGQEWEEDLRTRLTDRKVQIIVEYNYLFVPFLGPIMRDSRTLELRAQV